MVRGRAEDLHAREARREVEGIAVIDAARGAERAAADAAVGVFARFAEGVHGQLADGIAGLRLALHDLHAEGEHVTAQKVGIAAVDAAEEGELADAQMVDARGQRAVKHHVDGGGRAAGDILQLAANGALHRLGGGDQLAQLLRRGGDRAVAAEIRADARQLQMVELILDLKRGVDQFLAAPEALAQIAEVSHQDHPVARSALRADRVEGAERFKLALETHVRDLRDLRKLGEHGDADENALTGDARAAQGAQLTETGRGKAPHAAFRIDPGGLRQRRKALDHARDLDRKALAALDERCQICFQLVKVDL